MIINQLMASLRETILPKKKTAPLVGESQTSTYNPRNLGRVLTVPTYRDHLKDLYTDRLSSDSRTLLADLFTQDPDVSSAVNAYLTVSNTKPTFHVYNDKGELDEKGAEVLQQVIDTLTSRTDFTTGFEFRQTLESIAQDMRYMLLLRGGICVELILDKLRLPQKIRQVDMATIEFYEDKPGVYKPSQSINNTKTLLDFPTIFIKTHQQNPTRIYNFSIFVAAINIIAARQKVINTLYDIAKFTGYPRIDVTVLEEVIRNSAPAEMRENPAEMSKYLNSQIASIRAAITNLEADQALVHTSAIEFEVKGAPQGGAISDNLEAVIKVLNDQNQAALKAMGTVLGRGQVGVNTASTEARLFSMYADQLNLSVAEIFEDVFTLSMRLLGNTSKVTCKFAPAELRPDMELEPQRTMLQSRLLKDLSLGVISDIEYHQKMYNRMPPKGAVKLSGTRFLDANTNNVDPGSISPNTDPLGRSLTPEGAQQASSNVNN
jgi:hypothetical protein